MHGRLELVVGIVPGGVGAGLANRLLGVGVQAFAEFIGDDTVDRPHAEHVLRQEQCGFGIGGRDAQQPLAHQLGPQRRHLRQHPDAGADVFAALGVVCRQRRHRRRPQPCPSGDTVVELRGADSEPLGLAADLVEGYQPRVAVEQAVLHRLRGGSAAQLLQPHCHLRARRHGCGDDRQCRRELRCTVRGFGQRHRQHRCQRRVVRAVHADVADQRRHRGANVGVVVSGCGDDGPTQPTPLTVQRVGHGLDLECAGEHRVPGVVGARRVDEFGQGLPAGGIDEQAAGLAQRVVAGGACDGQRRLQRFVDREDLLDHDPRVRPDEFAQPRQVARRIRQAIGMVDAYAVDETLGEPALDLDVRGVEHGAVLLAQPGQRGDGEEPAVPAHVVAPADQPVVLPIVHLRSATGTGARRDGPFPGVQPQHVTVDGQAVDVVVGTEDGQDDSAIRVQRPVDVEVRRVPGLAAMGEHIPPPRVLPWVIDADVVGHDVDDDAEPTRPGGPGQPGQAVGATKDGAHLGGVHHVVAVRRTLGSGQDRRQVQVADPEAVEIVEQVLRVGEGEPVTAHLQSVRADDR